MVDSHATALRSRQRKFHRRSRNGCTVCKQKHIRCDERRPLCTYCLNHGNECGYPDSQYTAPRPTPPGRDLDAVTGEEEDGQAVMSVLFDAGPRETLLDITVDLPAVSKNLFHFFVTTRVLYTTPIQREKDSFVVHRALSHPGFMHGALLMTLLQCAWSTGLDNNDGILYLYHKLQAIRFVNEQLADAGTAVHAGTIATVMSLALCENTLGTVDAVAPHLQGLARIKEIQDASGLVRKMGLMQKMILMAARCLATRPAYDLLDISRTDKTHQSIIISLFRISLRPIVSIFTLGGVDSRHREPLSEVLAKKLPLPQSSSGNSKKTTKVQTVDSSRSSFIACYFYLCVMMREDHIDPFVMDWFIEQLLTDVYRTENMMFEGQYPQSLWLWSVLFGACVATAARPATALEACQVNALRDTYLGKIRSASVVLNVKGWDDVKSTLRLFAWEDNFDGEEELRSIFEEALWNNSKASSPVIANSWDDTLGRYGILS